MPAPIFPVKILAAMFLGGVLLILPLVSGCQKGEEPPAPAATSVEAPLEHSPEAAAPPSPPILETFNEAPQLSLFARLGDYRPEEGDEVELPFWRTFLEHLLKTSGVVLVDDSGNRAFSFRSIKNIDSVGFFSPLAVHPDTPYRVSFKARAELPEGGTAGIGILEYDEFLWVAEQYPQSLDERHRTGQHDGILLTGSSDWAEHSFTFITGPRTGMIHLVLHRDGASSRDAVLFDDIRIEEVRP